MLLRLIIPQRGHFSVKSTFIVEVNFPDNTFVLCKMEADHPDDKLFPITHISTVAFFY